MDTFVYTILPEISEDGRCIIDGTLPAKHTERRTVESLSYSVVQLIRTDMRVSIEGLPGADSDVIRRHEWTTSLRCLVIRWNFRDIGGNMAELFCPRIVGRYTRALCVLEVADV